MEHLLSDFDFIHGVETIQHLYKLCNILDLAFLNLCVQLIRRHIILFQQGKNDWKLGDGAFFIWRYLAWDLHLWNTSQFCIKNDTTILQANC